MSQVRAKCQHCEQFFNANDRQEILTHGRKLCVAVEA